MSVRNREILTIIWLEAKTELEDKMNWMRLNVEKITHGIEGELLGLVQVYILIGQLLNSDDLECSTVVLLEALKEYLYTLIQEEDSKTKSNIISYEMSVYKIEILIKYSKRVDLEIFKLKE